MTDRNDIFTDNLDSLVMLRHVDADSLAQIQWLVATYWYDPKIARLFERTYLFQTHLILLVSILQISTSVYWDAPLLNNSAKMKVHKDTLVSI